MLFTLNICRTCEALLLVRDQDHQTEHRHTYRKQVGALSEECLYYSFGPAKGVCRIWSLCNEPGYRRGEILYAWAATAPPVSVATTAPVTDVAAPVASPSVSAQTVAISAAHGCNVYTAGAATGLFAVVLTLAGIGVN